MSVGLPGTGVGGLFYLVSALCMPFREAYRATVGQSDARTRGVVARQTAIALGVLGGIWLAGWLIGLVLSEVPLVAAAMNAVPVFAGRASNVLKVASFSLAFVTLGIVLGAVEIAGVVRRLWAHRPIEPVPVDPAQLTRDAA